MFITRWERVADLLDWRALGSHLVPIERSANTGTGGCGLPTAKAIEQIRDPSKETSGRSSSALGARYRRLRVHLAHGGAVLAGGRQVFELAYHLLKEPTTYPELGSDYFDGCCAERLKRRSLAQL